MGLELYAVIAVIFLVSLCTLLFVNKQLRGGKTYEEVVAEKRLLAEKLYGNKKKNTKKNATGKKNRERKQVEKSSKQQASIIESDQKSDSESDNEVDNNNGTNDSPKLHVEFTEAEIIAPETNTIAFKRQLSTGKINGQTIRKNSSTKPPGTSILVNKNTNPAKTNVLNVNGSIEPLNHFDKIQPKDDLEIKKHRDESLSRNHSLSSGPGNNKKEKKTNKNQSKKDVSPIASPEITVEVVDTIENHLIVPLESVAQANSPKESPKNAPKEKSNKNKNKRNDALIQQLVDAGVASPTTDAVSVNAIMKLLTRTELTRSEIQILIDFLLNKQQDTASVTHSDWSDDIVHKLRKQIEDKDRLMIDEQNAAHALQTKLREMRAEWNAERLSNIQKLNANADERNALKLELTHIQQDNLNEKNKLTAQIQHLQQKLLNPTPTPELAQQLQQLTDANNQYASELISKNKIIQDFKEKLLCIHDESIKKINDYEQKIRQIENDVQHLNAENQNLRAECRRKDEYEKLFAIQKYEFEQLEARYNELSKTNQLDDQSKVEIRNLQNALDTTKAELIQRTGEIEQVKSHLADVSKELVQQRKLQDEEIARLAQFHSKQIDELNSTVQSLESQVSDKDQQLSDYQAKLNSSAPSEQREEELFKQIVDYKDKNNELRKKNWKLVDALQKVEESAHKISSKCNLVSTVSAPSPVKKQPHEDDFKARTKQVLERLFPNIPSNTDDDVTYDIWLTNVTKHIEQQILQQQQREASQNKQIKQSIDNKNHQNGNNHLSDNGAALNNSTEELLLQNAKLKATVDEYKTIISETEGLLKHVEKKVNEQDSYWRNIVQNKDSEISSLQKIALQST